MIYSDVIFNEAEHTYTTPDGKKLSGITGMIDRQIFGGKYSKLPDYILREKAEYGSMVHGEIDLYYTIGKEPETHEGKKAISLLPEYEATEYLVSNNDFATKIDFVSNSYDLYDFKTSTVLDKERLSWQLSCCAVLFELQNEFPCGKLYGVHLIGDNCEVVEVERKPNNLVLGLFAAELSGERYFIPETEEIGLNRLISLESMIIEIKQQAEFYEYQKQDLLVFFEKKMTNAGMKKIETDSLIITKVESTTSKTIDTTRLKKELPEIAEKYEKVSERKGYIKLTIKR